MRTSKNLSINKGFALPLIITLIFAVGLLGVIAYLKFFYNNTPFMKTEAKIQNGTLTLPSTSPNETAKWKTYISQKYNYSFKYPPGMIAKNDESITGQGVFPDIGGKIVDNLNLNLIPASSTDIDRIKAMDFNIVIGVIDGVNMSLTDYSPKYTDKFYGKSGTLDQITINGQPAYKISAPVAKTVQVLLESKNKNMVYTIASHQRASVKAEEYSKTFDQILSTFKFTN